VITAATGGSGAGFGTGAKMFSAAVSLFDEESCCLPSAGCLLMSAARRAPAAICANGTTISRYESRKALNTLRPRGWFDKNTCCIGYLLMAKS
jgi:hypothetical protein